MTKISKKSRKTSLSYTSILSGAAMLFSAALISAPATAQQVGGIDGQVTQSDGSALAGVTIVARGANLPGARTTVSGPNGHYRMPMLPPGNYTLTFTSEDGSEQTRNIVVRLQQKSELDIAFGGEVEEIVVTGSQSGLLVGLGSLQNTLGSDIIEGIPTGQEYRDMQKLIPGVQYSEDSVRGPSAGGSGQDNNYQFDGVDVSLPMFGTLSAEPSSHDIASVSIIRGGAKATGFNRTGGFLMNTVSKSGTNEFHGEIKYQIQSSGMIGDRKVGDNPRSFDEDKRWITANIGGPVIQDKLFFYTSFYRPTKSRSNENNAYGEVPDYSSTRNEYFGKLTFAPTDNILLDASYRTSKRSEENDSIGAYAAASTSQSDEAKQRIAIVEGSWIIDDASSLSAKYTNFKLETAYGANTLFDFPVATGTALNIGALDTQGYLAVPTLVTGETAYNAFIQPYIDQYGFGDPNGGGAVGGGSTINDQDFSRESWEVAYDRQFYFGDVSHELHIGYQHQMIEEDLARRSNGWGAISILGGLEMAADDVTPAYFRARVDQMSLSGSGISPNINSGSKLQSFEINDTIETGAWTFNVGVLVSNDTLYGQGLKNNENTLSGFEVSPGTRYTMYETKWSKMIQPRIGINYDYSDTSSVYANYALYNPAASSLARAASWARNSRRTVSVYFDEDGNYIDEEGVRSSSGKMFVEDMDPRKIDEYLIGWKSQVNDALSLNAHVRHRRGGNFWEDTWYLDRVYGTTPPAGVPRESYIENLPDIRAEIGGSSYVIAMLDTAYTRYWEVSLEAEYSVEKFSLKGSYTWSHYYGNFDQDATTSTNDSNVFIGSSWLADGTGRQVWDNREGDLRGDRRHIFKLYGYYKLDWNAQFGGFMSYQSGQPWEAWDYSVYSAFTGSTSETSRYGEPAGSRTTEGHMQVDLNYTQNFEIFEGQNIQLRFDLYNLFNSQTGYNYNPYTHSAGFGDPRSFYNPRRIQIAAKYAF